MRRAWEGAGAVLVLVLALATLAGAPLEAQQVERTERTIRISAAGEARSAPDEAELAFAVETSAPTARAAGAENARLMERVVQALVRAGVPRESIETRNYSLHAEYAHDEPTREPRIRGYRASNQVALRTSELTRVGELIDVALGAGANRVDGVGFRVRDAQPVQAAALRDAVARARASAETMAAALGVRLGAVLDASSGVNYAPPPAPVAYRRDMAAAEAAPMTPIQPSEQTVRAHVSLVFAIESP